MKILHKDKNILLLFFPDKKRDDNTMIRPRRVIYEFFKKEKNKHIRQFIMALSEMIKNLYDHSCGGYLLMHKEEERISFSLLDRNTGQVDFTKPWIKKSKLNANVGLRFIDSCLKPLGIKYVRVTKLGGISYFGYWE
jgi:hypothetical protein